MSQQMFTATLVEMGFDQKQSELALTKTGSVSIQAAMDWILANPDWETMIPEAGSTEEPTGSSEEPTGSEIPVVPAPVLTEEEKTERAQALQDRLNKAREKRLADEKAERIEKEKLRRTEGKDLGQIKHDFEEKMMKKAAEERRRNKKADEADKKRVLEQIAADKAARIARNAAARGVAAIADTSPVTQEIVANAQAKKVYNIPTNSRIQFRFPDGKRIVQVFEAIETLSALIRYASMNSDMDENQFILMCGGMPPKKFTVDDHEKSLLDLGLVPDSVVMVQKKPGLT